MKAMKILKSPSVLPMLNDWLTLNETHREKTGPTDVLSFPADDDDFLGDIALAYEVMEKQAKEMGISTRIIVFIYYCMVCCICRDMITLMMMKRR